MLTMTDMFCGAGGSSTGALDVPGITVANAMNHWDRAIETHNTNHPETTHILADISQTDPRYVARTDILWASPECTNHSVAKGQKRVTNQADLFEAHLPDAAAERSRATMWDVPRFAEHHQYPLIITENVVDAAKWVMYDAWLMAMRALGYEHRAVYLNSMHAQLGGLPAPQSRDRMYVFFWRKGNPAPDFARLRPQAYCHQCEQVVTAIQAFKKPDPWGRYRAQYVYRCPSVSCRNSVVEPAWLPASHAIDWSIRGQRIGDRTRPLAEKTMRRIQAGLNKYGRGNGPLIVNHLSGSDNSRTAPVTSPLRTLAAGGMHESLLVPVEGRDGKEARSIHEAMRTQTTRNETGVLVPPLMVQAAGNTYDSASGKPGNYYRVWPVSDPMRTQTGTVEQGIVTGPNHMLMEYYGKGGTRGVDQPIPTISTVDKFAMVTMRGTNQPKHIGQPLDTFAANGNHHALMSTDVPAIEDCEFRMLEPHEITRGMAFPHGYIMTGTKREQVKQAGNAVTPPAARDLLTIGAESLGVTA